MAEFLDPSLLNATLPAAAEWRAHFSDLGSFASDIAFGHDPTAFGGDGANIAMVVANGIEIEAAEWAPNDIRFSATFPDGHSVYGGETFSRKPMAGKACSELCVCRKQPWKLAPLSTPCSFSRP